MLTAPADPGALAAPCPACPGAEAADILLLTDAPVMVATVFPDAAAAIATPRGTLHLVACTRCGLLHNRRFELDLALAGARYESSQASSPHFGSYTEGLAKEWVERHGLTGKHVIEVGCGQGDFMLALLRAGVGTVTGVDPLVQHDYFPAEFAERVAVDLADFADRHTALAGAALVCRHTIEHVPNVAGFLRLVAAWSQHNGGAPVLFEAPAAERIVQSGAFWDLYYEHCNYFSRNALRLAFECAGLSVTHDALVYGDQYILMDARYQTPDARELAAPPGWLEACARFGGVVSSAVGNCRRRMTELGSAAGGLVIWQGAAKTVGLLTSIGPDVPLRFAVDMNTRRHGFFLPPFGLQVRSPSAIADARPAHVVLMNPVYMDEVREILDGMGRQATALHSIDAIIAGD